MGLEHEVEFADIGEVALATARAGDRVLTDEGDHVLVRHGLDVGFYVGGVLEPVLDQLVRAVAHAAALAVDQGIVEGGHMAGCHPDLRVHEDRGVKSHVVGVFLHELLPPGALDVVLQLHAERAVIPGVREAAVDLRARVDEASALAQCDDLVHGFFGVLHCIPPCPANGYSGDLIK